MSLTQKLIAFVLFTATMLALGWVMKQIAPPISQWLIATLGPTTTLSLIGLVIVVAGGYSYLASRARS